LMTEEINYSYDGGLYGELIRNRIFQDRPIPPRRRRPASTPAGMPPETAPAVEPAGPATNPAVVKNPNLINWWLINSPGAEGEIDIDAQNPVNTVALKNSLRLDIKSVGPPGASGSPMTVTGASRSSRRPSTPRHFMPARVTDSTHR
ncbi:MAG: hypothetical protein H7144_06525, partial [Burkholderiales bacterium]|nr:hypothetical protein [Phycisphaerae bacterium]